MWGLGGKQGPWGGLWGSWEKVGFAGGVGGLRESTGVYGGAKDCGTSGVHRVLVGSRRV